MWNALKAWITAGLQGPSAGELTGHHFEFNLPVGTAGGFLLIVAAVIGISLYYAPKLSKLPVAYRRWLIALRCLAVAIALFVLFDPCIVAQRIRPGDQYIVQLFDDSMSMQIQADALQSRGKKLQTELAAASESFTEKLSQRYRLAQYGFSNAITPVRSAGELKFAGHDSDLSGAVVESLKDLEGVDVAAVILFSDGVQQVESKPASLPKDFASSVPVFTVGVESDVPDSEESTETQALPWRDLELGPLSVRRSNFDKSPLIVTASVDAAGLGNREAVAEVMLNDRVIQSSSFKVHEERQEQEVRFEFVPDKKEWLNYRVRARLASKPAAADSADATTDRVPQNNVRHFSVDNREKSHRVLYFGGRPNWENKFIRRALEEDEEMKMTTLIRISRGEKKFVFRGRRSGSQSHPLFEGFEGAQDRSVRYDEAVFLRIGVQGSELDKGYPTQADELFPYDLVIWGEIENDFFAPAHLEITRDYVRKRGGSLLLLGGPSSFTEGKYKGTILEDMMPVVLRSGGGEGTRKDPTLKMNFQVNPSIEGIMSGAWVFDPDLDANRRVWSEMPRLSGLNLFDFIRPGATVLANAASTEKQLSGAPLFAVQRYGEGHCAVLATGATWQWQLGLEEKDNRHERFWRQMVRSMIEPVKDANFIRDKADHYILGRPVKLEMLLRDNKFDERESLRTQVVVTSPSGANETLPVEESIHEQGIYATEFMPMEAGLHRMKVEALDEQGKLVGALDEVLPVEEDNREFQKARFNSTFLKGMAEKSGGKYFSLSQLSKIADEIPHRLTERAQEVRVHLWQFPGFFIALVLLLATEWFLRRRRGYA